MSRRVFGLVGIAFLVLFAGLPASTVLPAEEAEQQFRWGPARQRRWLRSSRQKVLKDCRALVRLTGQLRAQAERIRSGALPAEILGRLDVLQVKARDVRNEFEAANEYFLPVGVVLNAREIEEEANLLRETFKELPEGPDRKKLRRLAREVRDRADSIEDRVRLP